MGEWLSGRSGWDWLGSFADALSVVTLIVSAIAALGVSRLRHQLRRRNHLVRLQRFLTGLRRSIDEVGSSGAAPVSDLRVVLLRARDAMDDAYDSLPEKVREKVLRYRATVEETGGLPGTASDEASADKLATCYVMMISVIDAIDRQVDDQRLGIADD